jgi:hypothetical protein
MGDLTTQAYIVALLGRPLTDAELDRLPGLLTSASARIRAYTRQQFDYVADDVVTLYGVGSTIKLPQTPVAGVTRVRVVSSLGLEPVVLLGWAFDGVDRIKLAPLNRDVWLSYPEWVFDGPDGGAGSITYEVTYSHGSDEVPVIVQDVAAGMIIRVFTSPSMVAGMVNERIGQYSYQLQQGTGAEGAGVRLTDEDKDALADYGPARNNTVPLGGQ